MPCCAVRSPRLVHTLQGVNKHVEVERLVRAKYQDNLEFMQWMKRWYELNSDGSDYDAVGRRSKAKGVACNQPFRLSPLSHPRAM